MAYYYLSPAIIFYAPYCLLNVADYVLDTKIFSDVVTAQEEYN